MNYFKAFLVILGFIYLIFSLNNNQKIPILFKHHKNNYIFFDIICIFTLLYLVIKMRKLVAILPLAVLLYCYGISLNSQDKLWFSADALSAGIFLSIASYQK